MTTFVLVHGAFHGAWSWYKLIPILRGADCRVIADDLPGHGRRALKGEACSLEAYAQSACTLIDRADEPVILVGHSMGGAVISQAAEWRSDKISKLVYVAAFLLGDGQTIRDFSKPDAKSALYDNVDWSPDRQFATLRDDKFGEAFCHDGPHADSVLGGLLSIPEPMAPPMEAVHISPENFGRIARYYIECANDRALNPETQRAMHTASPCEQVFRVNAAHSPMLSQPEALAEIFLKLR
jgi:pimeloyl-ACP methyl ester carboxylesterase